MHFGLHLKNQGVISAEQLVAALEVQLKRLVPIGQLALEEGMLSARDIFDVLQAQENSPSVRFGEMAVEMGLMTRDDVMRLLMIQADRSPPIAEILVSEGILGKRQVEEELAAYRQGLLRLRSSAATKVVPSSRSQDAAWLPVATGGAI
jgi:hypothetical protein